MFIKSEIFFFVVTDCMIMQISHQMNIFHIMIQNYLKQSQIIFNKKNQFQFDQSFIVFDQMTRFILRHV